MTLDTFFLLSLSVAASLAAVLFLALILMGAWIVWRIKVVLDKAEQVAEATGAIASHMKDFVQTSTSRLVAFEQVFLTARGIRQVAGHIADAIHSLRSKKGDTYDES